MGSRRRRSASSCARSSRLETGGGNEFFGEPQLDVADLLRTAPDGRGVISCLELPAVQDKPRLWSTVLMWLVAELFEQLPEVGDRDKPRLVFFLDEAHLLFEGASKAFVESVVQTVRLIRSKGVGVFFVTQTPKDVPADVLGQLGNRVQHALRAFTPDDAKALRATVRTFPKSDAYDLEELLTQLGTGEAAVTILSESGVPTPVVHTRMRAPLSRMGPADDVAGAATASPLFAKYGTRLDSQSAREMLATPARPSCAGRAAPPRADRAPEGAGVAVGKGADAIGGFLQSSSGRALTREVVRGVFGMLKKGVSRLSRGSHRIPGRARTRRRRACSWSSIRGIALWQPGKADGRRRSRASSRSSRSAARERSELLADADRSSQDLQAAAERLRVSRAQLQVLLDSLEGAKRSTRWLRVFLPAR